MDDFSDRSQTGAAAILVAALLIGMVGVAALALDGSNAYRARSDAQRAADAAALAAAWEDCTGVGDPVTVGLAAATANGFPIGVTVSQSGDDWTAVVADSTVAAFGSVLGQDTLSVEAQAVARCDATPAAQYVLFTGGTLCNNSLSISGSSSVLTGNVHSNSDIQISGSANTVNGVGTSVGPASGPPSVNWVPSSGNPVAVADPLGWPVTYDIADYRPGGVAAVAAGADYHDFGSDEIDVAALTDAGLWDSGTSTITDGIYYTTDSVSISASSVAGTVTFVTDPAIPSNDGTISFSGSGHTLTAFDDTGLLLFSNHQKQHPLSRNANCTSNSVSLSGSSMDWTGIVYAPGGRVQMSGSSNTSVSGSIISLAVNLSGSSIEIGYNESFGADEPRIGLRE